MTLLITFLLSVLQVSAKESLDVTLILVDDEILPDEPLRFQVNIFRLGEKKEDVYFEYFIKSGDKIKFIESESVGVENVGSFFRTIELLNYVKEGYNELIVEGNINGLKSSYIAKFNVVKPVGYVELPKNYIGYLFAFIFLFIVMFIIFILWDYKLTVKMVNVYKKIGEEDIVR